MSDRIFKREPAVWIGAARVIIALLVAFKVIEISEENTAAVLTALGATLGLFLAISVRPFKWAALSGFVQAVVAAVVGFGIELNPEQQGAIFAAVAVLAVIFERQVSTPEVSLPAKYGLAA